jgi:hypothetical protein
MGLTLVSKNLEPQGFPTVGKVPHARGLMQATFLARLHHFPDDVQSQQLAVNAFVRVVPDFFTAIVPDHAAPSSASGHFIVDPMKSEERQHGSDDERERHVRER